MRLVVGASILIFLLNTGCKSVSGAKPLAKTAELGGEAAQAYPQVLVTNQATYCRAGRFSRLKVDYARPDAEGRFPAVIFVHGGGWVGGSRSYWVSEIEAAAHRGFVAIAIDYRKPSGGILGSSDLYPAAVEDVRCAVRWARAEATSLRIDTRFVALVGASAGGQLALVAGFPGVDSFLGRGEYAQESAAVQAIATYAAPTDLTALYEVSLAARPGLEAFLGGTPASVGERYKSASPVSRVSANAPPFILLQGDRDVVVPAEQARLLDQRAEVVGVSVHELFMLANEEHEFSAEGKVQALDRILGFFEAQYKTGVGAR